MTGDLNEEARAVIEAARIGEEPTGADRARIRRALAAQVAVGAVGVAAASTAAHGGLLGGALAKVLGTAAVVAIGVGAGAAWIARERGHAPKSSIAVAPDLVERPVERPRVMPPPASLPAPGPAAPTPRARPKDRPPVADRVGSLEMETRLLADARAALRSGQPTRALSLLAEHERRFPAGILREEQSAVRVRALHDAGRPDEACAQAAAFLKRWARSPLAPGVQAICGKPP